jgi:hypothetical protein
MHAQPDPTVLGQWMNDAKIALDLVRGTIGLIPKSEDRQKVEASIAQAEETLARADAALAKELGYQLCQCTFPPQIMRWREGEQLFLCPNAECGRRVRPANARPIPAAKRCPLCEGEMKVISEAEHPEFGFGGLKVHVMKCSCGQMVTRNFNPASGYE